MQIKNRYNKSIIQGEFETLKDCVQKAIKLQADLQEADLQEANLQGADLWGADLQGADLRGADLRGADLQGADLQGANLRGANLRGADLQGANLQGANLQGVNLLGANLWGANLWGANLQGANLQRADLQRANLRKANLPTGEKWEEYLSDVVPALLTIGGKTISQVIASNCWDCHSWENCPMAFAFDVKSVFQISILHRPRAEQFIQLFDAKLIPCPTVGEL